MLAVFQRAKALIVLSLAGDRSTGCAEGFVSVSKTHKVLPRLGVGGLLKPAHEQEGELPCASYSMRSRTQVSVSGRSLDV